MLKYIKSIDQGLHLYNNLYKKFKKATKLLVFVQTIVNLFSKVGGLK